MQQGKPLKSPRFNKTIKINCYNNSNSTSGILKIGFTFMIVATGNKTFKV